MGFYTSRARCPPPRPLRGLVQVLAFVFKPALDEFPDQTSISAPTLQFRNPLALQPPCASSRSRAVRNLKSGLSLFLGKHRILERLGRWVFMLLAMALVLALPASEISLNIRGVIKRANVSRLSGLLLYCARWSSLDMSKLVRGQLSPQRCLDLLQHLPRHLGFSTLCSD